MPEISRFYGIIIYIFFREHHPAHFHAVYGENEALISIDPLGILKGHLPPKALSLVIEWASIHQEELRKIWRQAQNHESPDTIDPLR